jgi:curli biogenesis system outer membrane secretion channel CsgG
LRLNLYRLSAMSDEVTMATICSMIQGCGPFNQFKVDINKSKEFPPSREMKVGVLTFTAPAAGVSKDSPYGPAGSYTTPDNVGITVADAVSSELIHVPNVLLIERSRLEEIVKENELSLNEGSHSNDVRVLGQILPVDALIFGNVTSFQRWHDLAGHGGIVAYSIRLIGVHNEEELFSISCNAVKRGGKPENIVNDLSREAIKKLLEK